MMGEMLVCRMMSCDTVCYFNLSAFMLVKTNSETGCKGRACVGYRTDLIEFEWRRFDEEVAAAIEATSRRKPRVCLEIE